MASNEAQQATEQVAAPVNSEDADAELIKTIPAIVAELRKNFITQTIPTKTMEWRLTQLKQIRKMLVENKDKFDQAMEKDLGKSVLMKSIEHFGLLSEVDHIIDNFVSWLKPKAKNCDLIMHKLGSANVYYDPLGVVCVIAPWNFPISLLVKPLAGAIAAGNTVVLRPSEVSANVQALFKELVPKYLDQGAVRVFCGGLSVSKALLEEAYDYIFYTGSTQVGKYVMEKAAKNLTPMTLELGGKSPTYIDKDIDLDLAAKRIAWGKYAVNCGQVCVAPDYLLVHKDVADKFEERFKHTVKQFFGEDASKSKDYNRIVSLRHWQRLTKLIEDNKQSVVMGGDSKQDELYIAPTLLKSPDLNSAVMQDEIFGPILPMYTVTNVDEAIAFIRARAKPLALYIYSTNEMIQQRILYHTSSGGVGINECISHVSVPSLPFGGVGNAGFGSYGGKKTVTTFVHKKSVYSLSTRIDPSTRYPPLDEKKMKQMVAAYAPLSISSVFNLLSS